MRHQIVTLFLCAAACACAPPAERRARAYARDFVQSDARSDAANTANDRCGGDAELIAGRGGLSPDDYRCAGKASQAKEQGPSCYSRPADFMEADDWWKGLPPGLARYPRNVIKVQRTGSVTWNGADLMTMHGWGPVLDMYLEIIPQLNPPPIIFLHWEDGAPCDSIEHVRALMRKHLKCNGSRACLQGLAD